jgi:5'-phosphate synthase pdxT subunit
MIVGVLALQGDFPEHRRALARLLPPEKILDVRGPKALERCDAILLPGGESTAIARYLADAGLWYPLGERLTRGMPVLATCAGLILLAKELEPGGGGDDPPTLGALDIRVRRNDYGRQRESFEAPVRVEGLSGGPFPGVFIRAPRILKVVEPAEPFAFRASEVVGVRQGSRWALSFHPELSNDPRLLSAFLEAARKAQTKRKSTIASNVRARPRATKPQ